MQLFDLTIEKVLEYLEKFPPPNFEPLFENIKTLVFLLSLIYSLNLILLWIYYEIKNKDEIGFWLGILNLIRAYKNSQKKLPSYEEIKKVYLENHKEGIIFLRNYLNEILEILGFSGGNLIEKIGSISEEDLPNKENLIKAIKAINILEQKSNPQLTEEEFQLIYSEIEKALYYLNIIDKEDFLVKIRE